MYTRYIPQPDGSYRRNRVEDPRPKPPPREEFAPSQGYSKEAPPPPCPPPEPKPHKDPACGKPDRIPGFLQQLLPKDFDTGDLIVILLLLLLAGDCEEDRSTALLTLALYLIM